MVNTWPMCCKFYMPKMKHNKDQWQILSPPSPPPPHTLWMFCLFVCLSYSPWMLVCLSTEACIHVFLTLSQWILGMNNNIVSHVCCGAVYSVVPVHSLCHGQLFVAVCVSICCGLSACLSLLLFSVGASSIEIWGQA